ncbi:chitinase [Cellvibrio mixtus]|uniref:chitinase n=1 Tax=Cellvibrio mixtus TaxID=39650 RepID=UPI000A852670|nr:glycosyl hydrolase family 18 protein [Cellvibrio mixtus]
MRKFLSTSFLSNSFLSTAAGVCLLALSFESYAISCAGIPQWNSASSYGGGSQVQEAGKAYKANWWSQGKSPTNYSGQWQEWTLLGVCDGVSSSINSTAPSSSRSSIVVSSSSLSSVRSSSSVPLSASSVTGGNCVSPQYVAGTAYALGQFVKNAGNEYRCTVAGWCSSSADWAYAPGTGAHWQTAWELVRACATASSSSVLSSVSSSSSRSSISSTSSSADSGRYRIISGYWHNFNNGSGVIPLDQVSDAYDAINISFAEPTGRAPGEIGFVLDAAFDPAAFKAAIKAKQAAGKKIIISIGGANGQVQLPTAAARANFVNSMKAIIDEYGFDGLDVDFEGHSLFLNSGDNDFRNPTTPVIVNLIGALKDLTSHYGDKFVLTMAPETFFVQLGYSFYGGTCISCDTRAGAYLPVIYALRDQLDWLQVQNYNSGAITGTDNKYHTMGGADFHIALIDMLLTGFKVAGTNLTFPALRQDQVLIGLPANVNAGGGFTSVTDVQTAMNCLIKAQGCTTYQPAQAWTNLRGLMTWSINWDKFNNSEFSTRHRQYLDQLP